MATHAIRHSEAVMETSTLPEMLAIVGGLRVLLGFKARFGALLLIVFLIPVTLIMGRFWELADAQATMMQRIHFLKNVSVLGGAMILAYFGAGPISIDARHP